MRYNINNRRVVCVFYNILNKKTKLYLMHNHIWYEYKLIAVMKKKSFEIIFYFRKVEFIFLSFIF